MTLQSMGAKVENDAIGRTIASLAPWFHNIALPSGHQTAADHPLGDFPRYKWEQIAPHIPSDLSGWTALDIGCNAGFYTFELARRGADVLAIDHDEHYLRQARWVSEQLGGSDRIRFERLGVYELVDLDETFDLVLFMGVLYHLRYPLLALDVTALKARKLLLLQTLTMPGEEVEQTLHDLELDQRDQMTKPGWPKMAFIEHRVAGDATNWWAPNHAAVEAMVRSCGMNVLARPGDEIYVCAAGALPPDVRTEMHAATRRERRTTR